MNDKSRVHGMIAFCALLLGLGYYSTYFLGLGMPELGVQGVRVCILLLSGLFLLFELFGCFFLLFGREPVFLFFAVWARARAPPKQQNKTRPRPNSKKINTPPPLPSFFFAFWAGGRVSFFAVWAGCVFLFFAVWAGVGFFFHAVWAVFFFFFFAVWAVGVFIFCCLGAGRVFCFAVWAVAFCLVVFAVWAVGVFIFCCLGAGRVFFFFFFFFLFGRGWRFLFFALWAGNGSSLTYRSCLLIFKRPNNKKDQTAAKNKTRVPVTAPSGKSVNFCVVWYFLLFELFGYHLPVCLAHLQATQQQKRPNSTKKHAFQFRVSFRLGAYPKGPKT